MNNLVFISGDFSSGSTLLFTLFRKSGGYHCLYEPLHEKILEYIIWPLRVYEHHFFVEDYFAEYKGFRDIFKLFNPKWGSGELSLSEKDDAEDLYRYINYIIESSFERRDKVMLQFNRATFRLGWLKSKFPHAKIIHIYRNKDSQWNSIVKRVQLKHGREDVGQSNVGFTGFNIATWCEDLKDVYPQLDKSNSKTGYERFSKLWELSFAENQKYADISVDFMDLTKNFEETFGKIAECVEHDFDIAALKKFVIPPEKQKSLSNKRPGIRILVMDIIDKVGRKYARARLKIKPYL